MVDNALKGLKYLQIVDFVQGKITSGDYAAGQQIPTQIALARQFRTSRPTVEKALDALELKGLIIRKKGSGTFVSGNSDRGVTQLKIGFLAPRPQVENDFEHHFINMVFSRISNESKTNRFALLGDTACFGNADNLLGHVLDTCDKFIRENIKGVFYVPVDFTEDNVKINQMICDKLDAAGIRIILIDRDICQAPERSRYDVIGINNRRASYRLTTHLIEMGLKAIYFVGCRLHSNVVRERIEGFLAAMSAAGLTGRVVLDYDSKEVETSSLALQKLLKQKPRPQGVVCINDETAGVVMRDALKLKIELPGGLRITGFDDLPASSLLYCPLTTIRQPVPFIARQAVARMFDRMANPDFPAMDIYISEQLIIRES